MVKRCWVTPWREVITDDFDAGYSAIAEMIAVEIWDMPLSEIYAQNKSNEHIAKQCTDLQTTVLVEALKMEEQDAIDNYRQAILGAPYQKEN